MSRLGASQIEITGGFAALARFVWQLLHQDSNLGHNNPANYAGSNSNSIFKLVTALIVKAMRNKKKRRKIFIGPCT